ncbi:hypothetical protein BDZ89DRAFT_1071579 [Hymenopellis radicata]|nr:hypothetical protein BDZ89DRAFT_1071579 [Hymenopellis radicata]
MRFNPIHQAFRRCSNSKTNACTFDRTARDACIYLDVVSLPIFMLLCLNSTPSSHHHFFVPARLFLDLVLDSSPIRFTCSRSQIVGPVEMPASSYTITTWFKIVLLFGFRRSSVHPISETSATPQIARAVAKLPMTVSAGQSATRFSHAVQLPIFGAYR